MGSFFQNFVYQSGQHFLALASFDENSQIITLSAFSWNMPEAKAPTAIFFKRTAYEVLQGQGLSSKKMQKGFMEMGHNNI